ncbi:hypothetical protein TNCV_1400131 [Trichonephila clavipes]|nr:hypothetical protein TNCV_1400131 [Trichonephila clavipes]
MCIQHDSTKHQCDHLDAVKRTCIHLKKLCIPIRVPRFILDHTIEDAPVCDATSRVAAAIVSQLRVNAAANMVELFMQILVTLLTTPIQYSGLMTWLHNPLCLCG